LPGRSGCAERARYRPNWAAWIF